MPSPFQGFAARMLTGSMLGEVMKLLPEPAREALSEVRDYVAEHGRFPKMERLVRTPLAAGSAQAVNVLLGALAQSELARMVNLHKGNVEGGTLRGCNALVGDVLQGHVSGANAIVGAVRGGLVERVNLLVGDVHGGEVKTVSTLVGDVHDGTVQCHLLVGNVLGGRVTARYLVGETRGGEATIETKL
jgi:hypothetical protein